MSITAKRTILSGVLLGLSSIAAASTITITEAVEDMGDYQNLTFTVTNHSGHEINAFAIGNDSAAEATDTSGGWNGQLIENGYVDINDQQHAGWYGQEYGSGDSYQVPLANDDLPGYSLAFYWENTSSPLQDGDTLVVEAVSGFAASSFVALDLDNNGNVIHKFSGETTPVPLPAAAWLFLSGLASLWGFGKRRTTA